MDTAALILIAVVAVLVVVVALLLLPRLREKKRSRDLRSRFGPEYDRAVDATGDRVSAEEELEHREERRAQFDIRPLEPAQRRRYADVWRETQKRFLDSPGDAIGEADELVSRVMRDRGYPVDDFAQRAEDLSVDHPGVVEDYRAGNHVAVAHKRGEASTEDLRQALVHYRSLFDRLLDDGQGSDDAHDRSHK
ncbi:MAG: hypothetical protein M3O70_13375, partial [Actinomycetota bacterium]|nr:hypothetical protein [Actinomycetota bacterium]